jgi:uroporphyrin-III C-methyltransferase/precorrin-2 dehydrogenase/sirohydrochlorin ferrochelatase
MQHLPLFADLKGRPCVVIGAGHVAERRVSLLLDAGASVTVVAPQIHSDALAEHVREGRVEHRAEVFADQPLEGYWLVVAATDDRDVNGRVARAAERARRFCNVVDDSELCSFIMPAIVDRAPVTVAIGSGGNSPVVSRWVKGLVEALLPQRLGSLAALAGRWRERARAALPDATRRRHFWQEAMTGAVADHAFAGRDAEAEAALEEALAAAAAAPASTGEAYLVGAGPGSPDLITIRGRQLLAAADVVLYDRLASPALLAFARRDAELVSVGKTPGRPSITQKQINRLLVQLVQSGKRVCRLKGGDPMVFGRAGEELEALVEAGLKFQIVPGVSAAEGCAAYAGIPLTLRGVAQAVVLTTGHAQDEAEVSLAAFRPGQTLALYMGVAHYAQIGDALIQQGHDPETPVAIVEHGTTERQRVIRTVLRGLGRAGAALEVRAPALLLVGETTRLAERYRWFVPGKLEFFPDASAAQSGDAAGTRARVSY